MLRYFQIITILTCFFLKLSVAVFSVHRECVEYAKNHTICATMEACDSAKCAPYTCEVIPPIHFHNIAVILRKRLRYRYRLKRRLNPLLYDPAQTSMFMHDELGAYCGRENRLLRRIRLEAMVSEGVVKQLFRKASIVQRRYLYARDDCLDQCTILGIDWGCEMVPEGDREAMKAAAFRHLEQMILFQCSETPMVAISALILIIVLVIIFIVELVIGLSRITGERRRVAAAISAAAEEEDEGTDATTSTIGSVSKA